MNAKLTRAKWLFVISASLSLAVSPVVRAAEEVGAASSLRPRASQTQQHATAVELSLNAAIYRNAVLTTAPQGALEVTFLDTSKLSMGGGSSLVIDAFVYAGQANSGQQVVKYTRGAFRFISGSIAKDRVRIETPTVTIGIRGTTIRTLVTDDGTTTVGLDHGDAFVTSKQTGQTVFLTPGEKITIKPSGEVGSVELGKVEGCD